MSTTSATYSFLTTGPGYSFILPNDFDSRPTLSSPLENGRGGRSFDYVPAPRDQGNPSGSVLIDVLRDASDRAVELFWRLEEPPMWWLRWHLESGYLVSHLREEDG
jgi:hypothetical protein